MEEQTIQIISAVTQAVSTVILVGVTIYYAIQTKNIVDESTKQRIGESMPFLIAESFTVNKTNHKVDFYCVDSKIKNVGKGVAMNLLVSFYDRKTGEEIAQSEHLLSYVNFGDTENTHIHISKKSYGKLRFTDDGDGKMSADIDVEILFQDIYKRNYSIRQPFSLEKTTNEIKPMLGGIDFKALENN